MDETQKITVGVGEQYPALFIGEPYDDYGRERAVEIPVEMYAQLTTARRLVADAERAILSHAYATGQLLPTSDVVEYFGDLIDGLRENTPEADA